MTAKLFEQSANTVPSAQNRKEPPQNNTPRFLVGGSGGIGLTAKKPYRSLGFIGNFKQRLTEAEPTETAPASEQTAMSARLDMLTQMIVTLNGQLEELSEALDKKDIPKIYTEPSYGAVSGYSAADYEEPPAPASPPAETENPYLDDVKFVTDLVPSALRQLSGGRQKAVEAVAQLLQSPENTLRFFVIWYAADAQTRQRIRLALIGQLETLPLALKDVVFSTTVQAEELELLAAFRKIMTENAAVGTNTGE